MMMLALASFLVLLFITCYLFIRNAMLLLAGKASMRSRLSYLRNERFSHRFAKYVSRYPFIYRHLTDLLESMRFEWKLSSFIFVTIVLVLSGIVIGAVVFNTLKGVIVFSLILGALPYLVLRMRLIGLQMKTRLEFLPAVEVFYQQYVLSSHKNIRSVIRGSLAGNRMMYPVKSVFEQLDRNLATNREVEDCLRLFALSLGHLWADYFVSIIRFGLVEGIDVTNNVKELITDMRKAQRADQAERNRLLEIRLANFSPIVFLGVFLLINFQINAHNAYYYYLMDPKGRDMLLDSLFLIFCSFLMGVFLSIKRM